MEENTKLQRLKLPLSLYSMKLIRIPNTSPLVSACVMKDFIPMVLLFYSINPIPVSLNEANPYSL